MKRERSGSRGSKLLTRALTGDTLPDFVKLFEAHPGPGAFQCWCMYNHRPRPLPRTKGVVTTHRLNARNRRERNELVENGRSHGVLVYADGEPVGWCQYGLSEELPRIDNSGRYRKLASEGSPERLWRITCFVVDRRYRRRGVAISALRGAMEAIRKKGGGIVEAYPIARWGAYQEYRGTASMFEREGFRVVGSLGGENVLMRRSV